MTSPLELLTDRKNRQTTFLGDNWAPLSCGTVAFIGVCFVRYGTRRPLFSGKYDVTNVFLQLATT